MRYLLDTNTCISVMRNHAMVLKRMAAGLTLVTANTKEFSRVSSLVLEDWNMPT
jgi:predicted nucleic acid-binding protein